MGVLAGRVAVVTGGSSGIGAAVVARFVAEGARVASLDRIAPASPAAAVLHLAADVTDPASVAAAFARVADAMGGADILVNSAGIAKLAALEETTPELLDQILAVNVRGTMLCVQEAVPQMRAKGGGRIVNIGSVSGRRGNLLRTAYAASKGAIVTMSQVMAVELAGHGILVNVVAPGPVETPLTATAHIAGQRNAWIARVPLHRYAQPQEIAGAILFLAGPDATFITGHVLDVDGGFVAGGLLPGDARP
jgi:NAD(P)-dependent dehydrogenase (short-subunit alcohol dehydrogenase family)